MKFILLFQALVAGDKNVMVDRNQAKMREKYFVLQ
jgi:hypothetical protein